MILRNKKKSAPVDVIVRWYALICYFTLNMYYWFVLVRIVIR